MRNIVLRIRFFACPAEHPLLPMRPLLRNTISLSFAVCAFSLAAQTRPAAAPLPDPMQLLQRAIANEKKMAAEQERYECRVTDQLIQTDKNGNVKKTTTEVDDQFFVNGVPIEHTLSKNGKSLSASAMKKEDQRVMKETVKYSNQSAAQKRTNQQNQQVQDFLQAMMLTDGRRVLQNGRSVLEYDIVPNPRFQPHTLNQHIATVLKGTASFDERSGEMIDLNVRSVADIKLGGGLLANLHKGFWVHIHNHAEPDGVWLTDLAEGSGDARAALFFHPYFRFKETTDGCHLYSATAQQVGQAKPVK